MYLLGDVTFQDMPLSSDAASPAVVVNTGGSYLPGQPGLGIVAGLALAVWFLLRKGGRRSGSRFRGRRFGEPRRRNPRGRRRRRRNVLVWGA